MPKYMLLLRETPANSPALSPAQIGELIGKYKAWAQGLGAKGKLLGGDKLTEDGGKHLRLQGAKRMVTDGPFTEAKDLIGGFYIIAAADDAEAAALAGDCPHLAGSQWIEIRRIEEF